MNSLFRILVFLTVGTWGLPAAPVDVYLKIPGLPGESTNAAYSGWIPALKVKVSAERSTNVLFAPLTIRKLVDRTSPLLAQRCATGTIFSNAVIEFTLPTPTNQRFFQITLSNVLVTSVSSAGGSDRPLESIAFNYTAFAWRYTEISDPGVRPHHAMDWNVAQNSGGFAGEPIWLNGANLAGTNFQLSWLALQGTEYRILASDDVTGPYTFVQQVSQPFSGLLTTNFSIAPGRRFFIVNQVR